MDPDIAKIILLKNQCHHGKACKKVGLKQQSKIYQISKILDNKETESVFNII